MNPKKKFGQNFITDKNLIKKIVLKAEIEGKNVIEVGPGRGALTSYISKVANKVVAFEIDKDLSTYLDVLESEYPNLKIVYEDFLNTELEVGEEWELIGNLPYYITSPIIFKFLELPQLNSATIMIQKEVADRITSPPNSKKYNALSVTIQYLTTTTKLINVSRKMFNPIPNVDSVVIKLEKRTKRELTGAQEHKFLEFIKGCFIQPRKTLVNNLSSFYQMDKERLNALLKDKDYIITTRAEQLTIDNFIDLFRSFDEIN